MKHLIRFAIASLCLLIPLAARADGGPYKVVAADLDGDGNIDLALAHHQLGIVSIQKGDGKGNFSHLSVFVADDGAPKEIRNDHNIAIGDIDKDGLPDFVVGVSPIPAQELREKLSAEELRKLWTGRFVVARNLGHGKFEKATEFISPSEAKGVNLSDLDNDGQLDLLCTARGSGNKGDLRQGKLIIRQGLGNFKFGEPSEYDAGESAYYVETGDVNGDGFLDIFVPNEHKPYVQSWINPGRDIFRHPETLKHVQLEAANIPDRHHHSINDVRVADFNGDGKPDLISANLGTNTISIFPGNGDGTFQKDMQMEADGFGCFLSVGDLNKDGRMDFVITNWTQDFVTVFLNKGDGTFLPPKHYKTAMGNYGVTLCDVDKDGILDIITANYRDNSICFLKGKSDGTFAPAVTTKEDYAMVDGKWTPR